jgi:hypothetical protein
MIDHTRVIVSDFKRSKIFYYAALARSAVMRPSKRRACARVEGLTERECSTRCFIGAELTSFAA